MNKLLIALISTLTLGATLPAFAGPDWQVIEQARKAKQATQTAKGPCPPAALVLPLDHGPRAQTTPAQNQLRKDQYEAQLKACR